MTKPISHILWATDFSDESKEALAYADFFAKTFKAKLTALHVVPDFAPALYEAWPEVQAELTGQIEASKTNAKIKLDQMCETQGVCPNKVIIAEGSPAPIVLQTARKVGADLIVVSPGVPQDHPLLLLAKGAGVEIISEIELASRFIDAPIIAITGTNGKTTTTAMIAFCLERLGLEPAFLIGGAVQYFAQWWWSRAERVFLLFALHCVLGASLSLGREFEEAITALDRGLQLKPGLSGPQ